jgi:hypothetical protein
MYFELKQVSDIDKAIVANATN